MNDIEGDKKIKFNELLTTKFETNLDNFLKVNVDLTKFKFELEKKKIEEKNPKKKATKKNKKSKKKDQEKMKSEIHKNSNRLDQLKM